MSQKVRGRIHLIYGLCLTVLIVAVGVCFALSCLSIYKSGGSPFTRESISAHFDRMAIPVYLCIAGVIGGMVLALALPLENGKIKPQRDGAVALEKLSAKLDLSVCDGSVQAGIRKERRFRRAVTIAAVGISVAALLPAVVWCVNPAHFSIENLNQDMVTAASILLPCAAVALGAWVTAVLLQGASVSRETSLVKAALVANKGQGIVSTPGIPGTCMEKRISTPRFVWIVRGVILVVGMVFVVLGVLNGGMADVLGKAIRICTECIGLG